jgi:hypothetical protein
MFEESEIQKGPGLGCRPTVERDGRRRTVYLYDNARGQPERHPYREGVKLEAEAVPTKGSARLDLPAAIEEIKARWEGMVERWER